MTIEDPFERSLAERLGSAVDGIDAAGVTTQGVRGRVAKRRRRRRAGAAAGVLVLVAIAATVAGATTRGDGGAQVQVSDEQHAPRTTVAPPPEVPSTTGTIWSTTSSSTPATSTTSTTEPAPPAAPAERPTSALPPQKTDLVHGGVEWAVVLAVATNYDDRALAEATWSAGSVGYETGPTDCDVGVHEIAGIPSEEQGGPHLISVSLYFRTRAEAEQFVVAYETEVVGIGQVKTMCMD